ncbi:hypothetical protein PRIC2_013231 [Phytophthora ramorum]
MEGGDLSAVVGPPPKARRGSGAAIYEKYLNIKKNTLVEVDGPADPTNKPLEISNSTDEQELEAGEVVSTEENDAACANGSSGPGVSVAAPTDGGMSEPEMEEPPQTQPKPQQAASDTPPPEASAASAPAAGSNIQLTAVGTSCASADASASTTGVPAAPPSPSAAAFERARAPALSNSPSPSHSPLNEHRSRSPPRGPPRDGNGFPPDRRPGSGSPGRMGMGGGPRSPPRGGFGGRGPSGPPPFDDRNRGPSPMNPPRGGGFGPRFDDRGPPGPPNMFPPQGRSPNRPPSADMIRKRDRSWERGGPPPDMMRRPFNGPLPDSPRMMEPRPFDAPSEWNFELKRSGKVKCRCRATSMSVGFNGPLPLYLNVMGLPHLSRSPEFLQLERPNVKRSVYELKPETMADANGYREFIDYLIQGRGGHARAGAASEMESQGIKIFILPPGQAARQLGYKAEHMIAVLRSH